MQLRIISLPEADERDRFITNDVREYEGGPLMVVRSAGWTGKILAFRGEAAAQAYIDAHGEKLLHPITRAPPLPSPLPPMGSEPDELLSLGVQELTAALAGPSTNLVRLGRMLKQEQEGANRPRVVALIKRSLRGGVAAPVDSELAAAGNETEV